MPSKPGKAIVKKKSRTERRAEELREIEQLQQDISKVLEAPTPPSRFTDLPLSSHTQRGLADAHFVTLTDIQKCALPVALAGLDVWGTAKTGSGKTLAFLIPVLELLYRERWTRLDGLGALILAPTRELALQTFQVLRTIGRFHGLSAGLVIGGKELRDEQEAISCMNILVATPGRLLQHLDQTASFDWSNLRILVLDEADRILDLGFARTLDAIIAALPRTRQTLLFSATSSTADGYLSKGGNHGTMDNLVRLSLQDPVRMAVHAEEASATPNQLTQRFLICPLEEKLDRLFSFIKANLKRKMLIFFSSCKQVRFVYEAFCRLQPGIPLLQLHGRQKQTQRMIIFQEFSRRQSACLFATDVAARGLDFAGVDWVVQVDCPEDEATYIHRVGRTARFDRPGNALLFLLVSEVAMIERLQAQKVPISSFYKGSNNGSKEATEKPFTGDKTIISNNNPPPSHSITAQLQALCSQDPEIKYLAQKALISYVRSVFLNGLKDVFKVEELSVDKFAASLGLASTPRLRFISKSSAGMAKNRPRQTICDSDNADSDDETEAGTEKSTTTTATTSMRKIDRMFKRKNQNVLSTHYEKLRDYEEGDFTGANNDADDDDDNLLMVKRRDHEINPSQKVPDQPPNSLVHRSRRDILKTKKRIALKGEERPTRLLFDDEGDAHEVLPFRPESTFEAQQTSTFLQEAHRAMAQVDKEDARRQKEALRQVRLEKKRKQKERERTGRLGQMMAKVPRILSTSKDEEDEE